MSPQLLLDLTWSDWVPIRRQQLIEREAVVQIGHLESLLNLFLHLGVVDIMHRRILMLLKLLIFHVLKQLGNLRNVELRLVLMPNLRLWGD